MIVEWYLGAVRRARTASNQNVLGFELVPILTVLHRQRMRVQKQCQTLIDADSVPPQLSSDNVGFALDDFSYPHRNIANRNVAVRYMPVTVVRFDRTAGKLKDSFPNPLAWN